MQTAVLENIENGVLVESHEIPCCGWESFILELVKLSVSLVSYDCYRDVGMQQSTVERDRREFQTQDVATTTDLSSHNRLQLVSNGIWVLKERQPEWLRTLV